MDDEQLAERYREALKTIEWLEKEVIRLKLLLEGKDIMMNSLPNTKD